MSLNFKPGDTLGPEGLYVNVILPGDKTPGVPSDISYTIYRGQGSSLSVFSDFNLKPAAKPFPGAYYVDYTIPTTAPLGPYTVVWNITPSPNALPQQVQQTFYVQDLEAISSNTPSASFILNDVSVTPRVMKLLKYVRIQLRDNNPDRNYHALPPRSSREVQGLSSRVGFIWPDEDLLAYVNMAVSDLCAYNPKSSKWYDIETFPQMWLGVVVDLACIRALEALAINWVQDEFGYNISGLSLDLNKSDKFTNMKASLESNLAQRMDNATQNRPTSRAISVPRWNI